MIIGVSGAHGAGKSSLLEELKTRGEFVDDFKVARSVQKELGWASLSEVMSSFETMKNFQTLVVQRKQEHDEELLEVPSIVLTERTFADIYAYTCLWSWKMVDEQMVTLKEATDFILPFAKRCELAQSKIYNGIVLLPFMKHMTFEKDPNRADEADVHTFYEEVQIFVERKTPFMKKLEISTETVQQRADEVQHFLGKLVF